MRNFRDVKVGDTLYDSGVRSDSRQTKDPIFLYVVKVARQYIYANPIYANQNKCTEINYSTHKIDRASGLADGWQGFRVYHNEEEFKEIEYRRELCARIAKEFVSGYVARVPDVTTAELQQIAQILKVDI